MNESDDLYEGGFEGHDQLDPSETLTGDNTEDPLDAGYSPPDREPRNTRYGNTAEEARAGESLDQHLAEEEPDISADDPVNPDDADAPGDPDSEAEPRAGRLVAPDEGAHENTVGGTESEQIASDVGRAGSASSSEEAAIHIREDDRPL